MIYQNDWVKFQSSALSFLPCNTIMINLDA